MAPGDCLRADHYRLNKYIHMHTLEIKQIEMMANDMAQVVGAVKWVGRSENRGTVSTAVLITE